MKITEQNRELVRAFIKVLVNMNVSQEAATMICIELTTKEQMDQLVDWIKENPTSSESDILKQVDKIVK